MNLLDYRSDVTSSAGEDGIIAKIFNVASEESRWCVELGALNGTHDSNVWNLIRNKHWSGVLIEAEHPVVLFEVNLSQLRAHGTSLRELGSFFSKRNYRLYLPFRLRGELVLGSVPSLSLVALFMYPGAYLLRRTSFVFDILALPQEKLSPLPIVSAWNTLTYVFGENLRDKVRRGRKHFV